MTMQKQVGFTLMELIVTLAIAAILMTLGLPNLRDFVLAQSLEARANGLLVNLNFARGEAVTRNNSQGVVITPYQSGNWSSGWRICSDDDGDGTNCETNVDPPELLREISFDDAVTVVARNPTTLANMTVASITYQSNGKLAGGNAIEFKICSANIPKRGKLLSITATGRTSIKDSDYVPLVNGKHLCE